jgi:hypothetical protein
MSDLQHCQHEGEFSWWEYDGYGIPLCEVCDKCHDVKMSKYRVDIHEHYATHEQIEPDY